MTNSEFALQYILLAEGGFLQDVDGITYEGLCEKDCLDFPMWDTVKAAMPLKRGEIITNPALSAAVDAYYEKTRLNHIMCDEWVNRNASAYFADWFVNAGGWATKHLQEIVGVTPDKAFGPGTLAATNAYQGDLLTDLYNARVAYYNAIGVDNPNLQGWLNRANKLYADLTA